MIHFKQDTGFGPIYIIAEDKGEMVVSDSSGKEMEICLIRHGKPQFWKRYEPYTVISGVQVENAILDYYNSGIETDSLPPQGSLDVAKTAAIAICSGVKRTVETAAALGIACRLIHEPLFREPEVPYGFWRKTRLPLMLWFIISKIGWLFGYSLNCESIENTRIRAEKAASYLIKAAKEHGRVVLVGHSFMNSMIFRVLQKRQWRSRRPFDWKFWGCNVLTYQE
ncbi:MAG: histidine phosphatase family protein [Chitinispirillaceae bacterium]